MIKKTFPTHVLTPQTEQDFFGKKVLAPLLRGESLAIRWPPHGGVRTQISYLISHSSRFGYSKLGKNKIIQVHPNDLTKREPGEYFKLMMPVSRAAKAGSLAELKKQIEGLVGQGFHLIFVLDYFDELNFKGCFYKNLYSLNQIKRNQVHFIFIVSQLKDFKEYGEIGKLLWQNQIHFPLLGEEDSLFVAQRICRQQGYGYSAKSLKELSALAGGHPSLLRHTLRILNQNQAAEKEKIKLLLGRPEIKFLLGAIFESFSPEEKCFVFSARDGRRAGLVPPRSLLKMNYVAESRGQIRFFSPLFAAFVKELELAGPEISLDERGRVLVNGQPIKAKITYSESQLLKGFLRQQNQILTKEEISEILWGEQSCEKYSDWAIGQAIFQLRKKLAQMGLSKESLQTIKGRGYRFLA